MGGQDYAIGLFASICPGIGALVDQIIHILQLSSGSCQTMLSRIRWPSRSIHCSVIQQANTSMTAKRQPPTVVTTTSRIDGRGDVTFAPQDAQTSFTLDTWIFPGSVRASHIVAIASFVVHILSLLSFLFIVISPLGSRSRVGSPLTLVAPNIQKLFSNCVFGSKAVLNVSLEERLIRNAALQDIGMMLLVKAHQRFGRDGV